MTWAALKNASYSDRSSAVSNPSFARSASSSTLAWIFGSTLNAATRRADSSSGQRLNGSKRPSRLTTGLRLCSWEVSLPKWCRYVACIELHSWQPSRVIFLHLSRNRLQRVGVWFVVYVSKLSVCLKGLGKILQDQASDVAVGIDHLRPPLVTGLSRSETPAE